MNRACVLALALLCACNSSSSTPREAQAPDAGPPPAFGEPVDAKALLAQVDRLQDQLKDKPKSFEVLSALGNLYYENTRYLDAVDAFRLALAASAPIEAEAQALREKGVKPAAELPTECRRSGQGYGLQQIAEAARKFDPPQRLACLDGALEMAIGARSRRGNSLYLVGNPEGALAEHQRVLARSPDYPESLFFVGAILLEASRGDKVKLEEGKKYWRRLLEVAPDHPRAALVKESLPRADEIFAPKQQPDPRSGGAGPLAGNDVPANHPAVGGGQPGSPMQHSAEAAPGPGPTPDQVQGMADAVQGTERTPELEKGLDELTSQSEAFLDQGKYQEARDAIVRVMPMRPQDARTAADMGSAMRGLGRAEMAERVLTRALDLNPKQPRALVELGRLLASRGDKAGAEQRFAAAKSADPKFAQAQKVDEELAKLR